MSWYARGPERARQIAGDVFVVLWAVVWFLAARFVHSTIDAMGDPARASGTKLRQMADELDKASQLAGRVPVVGDEMGVPFRMLARLLGDLIAQVEAQAAEIGDTATIVSVLVFAIPVLVVAGWWLARRLSSARSANAAQVFINETADLDLYALRAMANVRMEELAAVSDDPAGAWRAGDREVIRRLAALEFARTGITRIALPAAARPARPQGRPDD